MLKQTGGPSLQARKSFVRLACVYKCRWDGGCSVKMPLEFDTQAIAHKGCRARLAVANRLTSR
jgi:hypothetical protein